MILLVSLVISLLLVLPKKSPVRHHAAACYWAAAGVSLLTIAAVWSGWTQTLTGWASTAAGILTQGGLSGSLFILVMMTGAAGNRSAFRKTFLPIRAEMSIIASILSLGHNIAFGQKYFVRLFTQAADLRPNVLAAAICSLVMLMIMLPLFVTSFRSVRRRMHARQWKRLQRLAYIFYALMPMHVLLLNYPSALHHAPSAVLNCVLYTTIFLTYGCLRLRKAFPQMRHAAAACAVFLWLAVLLPIACADSKAAAPEITAEVSFTDGTYTGAAIGYNGRLKVSVTISEGRLGEILLLSSVDDEPYLSRAAGQVFAQAMERGSSEVEAVSGATTTAIALKEAIEEALVKAKG